MEKNTCAFTGHRPSHFSFGYAHTHPDCLRLQSALGQAIAGLEEQGITNFITGMAQGVDLWAARQVLLLREKNPAVRLIAAIPCATQAGGWPRYLAREYEEILAQCDEKICLHETYTPSCMMERNRWMVDHAQVLLAVYDGKPGGGTAATVRYAEKKAQEIYFLDPESLGLVKLTPPQNPAEQLSLL